MTLFPSGVLENWQMKIIQACGYRQRTEHGKKRTRTPQVVHFHWEPENQGQADIPERARQPFEVSKFLYKERRAKPLIIKLSGTLPLLLKLFGIDNLQRKLSGVKKVINQKNEVQVINITRTSTSID